MSPLCNSKTSTDCKICIFHIFCDSMNINLFILKTKSLCKFSNFLIIYQHSIGLFHPCILRFVRYAPFEKSEIQKIHSPIMFFARIELNFKECDRIYGIQTYNLKSCRKTSQLKKRVTTLSEKKLKQTHKHNSTWVSYILYVYSTITCNIHGISIWEIDC